ncbi:MAG: hypothetical protein ABSF25_14395, partial [Bryobacteraceae bacterium]
RREIRQSRQIFEYQRAVITSRRGELAPTHVAVQVVPKNVAKQLASINVPIIIGNDLVLIRDPKDALLVPDQTGNEQSTEVGDTHQFLKLSCSPTVSRNGLGEAEI